MSTENLPARQAASSGNPDNSTSESPLMQNANFNQVGMQIKGSSHSEGSASSAPTKPDLERTGQSEFGGASDSTSTLLTSHHQRLPSYSSVGSSTDLFYGVRGRKSSIGSTASALFGVGSPGSIATGPTGGTPGWNSNSSYSLQYGMNPGQPSPPSSRRGSLSGLPFPPGTTAFDASVYTMPPRSSSFSFAADLNAPVSSGMVTMSSSGLHPPGSFDFGEDDPTIAGMYHLGPHSSATFFGSGIGDPYSFPYRRGSRGGDSVDIPETSPHFPGDLIPRHMPSNSGRGRGKSLKREPGDFGAPEDANFDEPTLSEGHAILSRPPGSLSDALIDHPIPHNGLKRRNSAVSLMLLGEGVGIQAPPSLSTVSQPALAQTSPLPAPTPQKARQPKTKKRKLAERTDVPKGGGEVASHEDDDSDLYTAPKDAEVEDDDGDYDSDMESASKRQKVKKSSGRPEGNRPVLKMEPVILPKHQQQQLEASFAGEDDDEKRRHWGTGRKKIRIEFIENKLKRQITFSKRKSGMMKKIHELTTLTGTEALLVLVSETGHIYSYSTPKLFSVVDDPETNPIKTALDTYQEGSDSEGKHEPMVRSTRSSRKSSKGTRGSSR